MGEPPQKQRLCAPPLPAGPPAQIRRPQTPAGVVAATAVGVAILMATAAATAIVAIGVEVTVGTAAATNSAAAEAGTLHARENAPDVSPVQTAAVATTRPLRTAVSARIPGTLGTGNVPVTASNPVTTIHRIFG